MILDTVFDRFLMEFGRNFGGKNDENEAKGIGGMRKRTELGGLQFSGNWKLNK